MYAYAKDPVPKHRHGLLAEEAKFTVTLRNFTNCSEDVYRISPGVWVTRIRLLDPATR